MVAKSPSLMAKANELAQQRPATAMPELQALLRDFAAQGAQTTHPSENK
jgi:hypothetical protein